MNGFLRRDGKGYTIDQIEDAYTRGEPIRVKAAKAKQEMTLQLGLADGEKAWAEFVSLYGEQQVYNAATVLKYLNTRRVAAQAA